MPAASTPARSEAVIHRVNELGVNELESVTNTRELLPFLTLDAAEMARLPASH